MELNKIETVKVGDFEVNRYLTYAQIQQIANSVVIFNTWAERQTNYDMLLLYHVTNIGKEELEKHSHTEWLESGIIDQVKKIVVNIDQIDEAIKYHESMQRIIGEVANEIVKQLKPLAEAIEKYGKTKAKK